MKSYYKFLETSKPLGETVSATRRPVYRSSAIFPVIHNPVYKTRISLMGYWLVKRQIAEVSLLYTLRAKNGSILLRKSVLVQNAKAFALEIEDLLRESGAKEAAEETFEGSLELEVFSTRNLFITYPAMVLCYYNDKFSSAVHTTGRVYNDVEDLQENEETSVAEAGFDIYEGLKPFVAFTNGPIANSNPEIAYTVINDNLQEYRGTITLPGLAEYETCFVYFDEHIDLKTILKGRPGTIKLRHNFRGFFPRLISGNFDPAHSVASITHTFYDCSTAATEQDYWREKNQEYHDAAIQIPLFVKDDLYTDLVFYPIYSPAKFELQLRFFNDKGDCVGEIADFLSINSEQPFMKRIEFAKILKEKQINSKDATSAGLFFNAQKDSRIPTRIKMGLNVGVENCETRIPCNICFAPKVGNPDAAKNRSFHWAPLLNIGYSVAVVTNTAPSKNYSQEAVVELTYFRESDDSVLSRQITIAPHGHYRIEVKDDAELQAFFQGKTGWVTMESKNPYVYGWYFDVNASGVVAGDHVF